MMSIPDSIGHKIGLYAMGGCYFTTGHIYRVIMHCYRQFRDDNYLNCMTAGGESKQSHATLGESLCKLHTDRVLLAQQCAIEMLSHR